MRPRTLISALTFVCTALWAATAYAQLGSSCLRPLGIPDKWLEMQTPPWDPTDTFDPTGPNPDIYYDGYVGFDPNEDQGRPMALTLYNRLTPPQGQSAWAIVVGEPGSVAFSNAILGCSGFLHGIGESFPSATGNLTGPFRQAMTELIARDPNARWDPTANGGRGGVFDSAFPQSPRVIALPVFAPSSYGVSTATSPPMVKIVGFFVSQQTTSATLGYLTGWSQLVAPHVTARYGDYAQLSATFTGPGSPIVGLPVEFLYEDMVVATADTDGTGTARPETTSFRITAHPGEHPGAIRVRLGEHSSFFDANEAVADLTVLKRLPVITWLPPPDIAYGTPLGPLQLNAVADVPGEFSYTPTAGTVLSVTPHEPAPLTATFVPSASESELYDQTTATTYINVVPAPLTVTVNDVSKLYLDPLPAFTFTAVGFVNGEGASVLDVSPTYLTSATASSDVGTYSVALESVGAANYNITLKPGVVTIVPRQTVTTLQSTGPSPSTYGQTASFTVAVSSGRGLPNGTVTLLSGGLPVATAPLVDGQASVTVLSLDAGSHGLSAQYSGSAGFAPSVSPALPHTVSPASTTTSLTSSVNPSRVGQAVTFIAAVSAVAPGAGVPTGSVEYLQGGVVIGAVPLTSGTAQLRIDTLTPGKYAIQARYRGTGNYRPSVSAVIQQAVKGGNK